MTTTTYNTNITGFWGCPKLRSDWPPQNYYYFNTSFLFFLQRNESELEGMAVASVVGDDSTNPASPNPEEIDGKEASGKKKKNRCLNCKKKVGLTGM